MMTRTDMTEMAGMADIKGCQAVTRASASLMTVLALSTLSGQALAQDDERRFDTGEGVYQHWCAPCHAPGDGHPGTQSLAVKYSGSPPAVLLEREDLTPEAIKTFVRSGVLSMPPFRKTEITDAELDRLAAWMTDRRR